ncbi:hypothetical protein ACROYT_G025220 [Oculina patagonica]
MSSIVTAVFKATIGLLVNKGRDMAAEKLKDGDVTDQKSRGLIVREIDDIKKKLDGQARKDLLASISFFEEGIEILYEVFDKSRSRSEYGAVTTQAACAEALSLTKGMGNLKLTDLDESATRVLSNAKKRFEDARRRATDAFKNEALETSDRILAMQYRVMATILETVDNPADAIAPCRVCIKELNSLSVVQNSFSVQLKKGKQAVRGLFSKKGRRKIIYSVCLVNHVIFDVTQTVGKDVSLWMWPTVDIGEDKVDPLRDEREGEEEHKLTDALGIATNSSGQFVVGDLHSVKVFDSSGKFSNSFSPQNDVVIRVLYILDVATDMNENIYLLVEGLKKLDESYEGVHTVYIFSNTADLHRKFPVRRRNSDRLTVTDGGKVLVLGNPGRNVVDVYETDGQFVRSVGEGVLKDASDITAAYEGRVMVVDRDSSVYVFSESGGQLNKFKLQRCYPCPRIAFHRASKHVVVAGIERGKGLLQV